MTETPRATAAGMTIALNLTVAQRDHVEATEARADFGFWVTTDDVAEGKPLGLAPGRRIVCWYDKRGGLNTDSLATWGLEEHLSTLKPAVVPAPKPTPSSDPEFVTKMLAAADKAYHEWAKARASDPEASSHDTFVIEADAWETVTNVGSVDALLIGWMVAHDPGKPA